MEILFNSVTQTSQASIEKAVPKLGQDSIFIIGVALVSTSALLFSLPLIEYLHISHSWYFTLFFIQYLIAIAYGMILLTNRRLRISGEKFASNAGCVLLLLMLYLFSAYALNRELPVFQEATDWMSVYLVVSVIACVGFGFRSLLPNRWQLLTYGGLGAALVLFTYLAVYLLPLYAFGLLGTLALGIGLHTFVPLLCVVYLVRILLRTLSENQPAFRAACLGMLVPVSLALGALFHWAQLNQTITHLYNESTLEVDNQLPAWVRISRGMPDGWMAERMLKTELIYETPNAYFDSWNLPSRTNFDERREHDPLVMIGTKLFGRIPLSEEEKIKILETNHDARHLAQERLWSGKDLLTSNVTTNVRLFPNERIAYTEQTIFIRNTIQAEWSRPQEAIYTFYLPEGAVVTSLSLWINGKEEPAYLTTKGKAEKAYRTIVGVESRDPSVVHWQEGNTVSVRVFPCTPREDRRFKIGITAPLVYENGKLRYTSIHFKGPSAIGATEMVKVQGNGDLTDVDMPSTFASNSPGVFIREGEYWSDWNLTFKAPAVNENAFEFNGKVYQAQSYQPHYTAFQPQTIYLDVNEAWTSDEVKSVWELVKAKEVYAFDNQLIRLTEENHEAILDHLQSQRFSLFPLHAVKQPASSLLLTKSGTQSPNLKDLKESEFTASLQSFLAEKSIIRTYNLGSTLSPYLKTLKEFRVLLYDEGDLDKLGQLLSKGQFLLSQEDEQTIVIEPSHMRIRQMQTAATGSAPDHLLRLFAYNHIVRNIGSDYFRSDYVTDDLIQEAEQANVVSPVSSLIVLETQEDYKRFDITKSQNSLGNASTKSSGAVPEPHEWMLIALVVGLGTYLYIKSSR